MHDASFRRVLTDRKIAELCVHNSKGVQRRRSFLPDESAWVILQGEFKLNKLFVGNGAVLCAHTRLLSGAAMSERSTLLEHTLVVGRHPGVGSNAK